MISETFLKREVLFKEDEKGSMLSEAKSRYCGA
jgi:hypothetical protein